MKEKIKKNDSMSVENMDLEVIIAAFEALLHRHELWYSYYWSYKEVRLSEVDCDVYTAWKEWATELHPKRWLRAAFIWKKSLIRQEIWADIDCVWNSWLEMNLKK